jgi:hypothetical protein
MTRCARCGGFYEGRHLCPDRRAAPVAQVVPAKAKAPMARGTYKYRDPVKRRAQVAAAVRKWRARKGCKGDGSVVIQVNHERASLGPLLSALLTRIRTARVISIG